MEKKTETVSAAKNLVLVPRSGSKETSNTLHNAPVDLVVNSLRVLLFCCDLFAGVISDAKAARAELKLKSG